MNGEILHAHLERLLDLILAERDAARRLDMDALSRVTAHKEACMQELAAMDELDEPCRELAEKVRVENRRNAYLFWTGLHLVRDTVAFFHKQATVPAYGASGVLNATRCGASLLSGRV